MKFWEAMKIVDEGGMVRRESWNLWWIIRKGKSHPITLIEELDFHNMDTTLSTLEMDANDWVEVKNKDEWLESIGQ